MHPRPQFEMPGLPGASVAPPEAVFLGVAVPGDRVVPGDGVVVVVVVVVVVIVVVVPDVDTGDTVNKSRIKNS